MSVASSAWRLSRLLVVCSTILHTERRASAQELVRISVPAAVSFDVPNVAVSTPASSNPTRVSFEGAILFPGRVLGISVRAEGDLTAGGGSTIPAAKVSWTTSNVSNGVGVNGTLSSSTYTELFRSQLVAVGGGADINWTLAPPGTAVRAVTHQVTLRWRVEAMAP